MSKKKKGGMGKGKGGEDEDTSTWDLLVLYRKNCNKNGITTLKQLENKFDQVFEEGDGILEELHVWEEAGPVGIRSFCEALRDIKYKHLKSMRFWRVKAQDEGVRTACDFLKLNTSKVTILDLLSNEITPLGCSFIADMTPGCNLTVLKLDHNEFGTPGLEELAKGLGRTPSLTTLSLSYCNIDEKGVPFLHQILAFIKTELKFLDLQGNFLKNEGVKDLFKALETNQILEEINLADNQFGEDQETMDQICKVFTMNKNLGAYDFNYNAIYDDGANRFLQLLKGGNKWIHKLELSEKISREIIKEMAGIMKKNKPKKKKGKKKKKS